MKDWKMVGVSRLFLPLLANQFDVLELLWQEIHRYRPKRDRFNAANRQNRTNPIEITWRNSCKIATQRPNLTPLVAATYLVLANMNSGRWTCLPQVAHTTLNPSIEINVESPQCYIWTMLLNCGFIRFNTLN